MSMRYILLLFVAVVSFNVASAKKVKFVSEQAAVGVIQNVSAKYWEKLEIKDNKGVVVKVSQQGSKLIFTETSTFVRPATIGRETFTETKVVTVEVDLAKAAATPTVSTIVFMEQTKNAIHQVLAWDKKALDNSNGYISMYTVPLDYPLLIKNSADLQQMKSAVRYLSTIYLPKSVKRKFSMKVGQ
ncbi:hypothetical protein CJD36_011150 [Flavipsychrobacter stenotrophus]|uniref:Uncharacterized protein n=2 Tax=Flavipsychrobacter stenotrophus TaxID=2077091 RepID=A0A2S7SUV7_9BACT|nr:hypothetical protein CJD36_011150 [Flavipsychrobacter stenotrophus]